MPWRHLARDFRASHLHHCYCSMPTALIWCQTCLGLRFGVWVSISGFGSLFVFGFVCQTSREHLTKIHKLHHHHWQCHHWWPSISILFLCSIFFFFSFGLVLCWFRSCSIYGLGFLCDIRIWWFLIWVWKGVWVWSYADLWLFFDLGFVSKWL